MKTLRRYMAREIFMATAFIMMALVMLFAFFDLAEEIKDLGRGGYQLRQVARHVLLSIPNHIYQLFPIAALIGTLFALAQLVASSEYTVMRTSGVSLLRINFALISVGLVLATLTFVFGEYVGPPAEQLAHRLRSQAITGIVAQEFRSGLWLKDEESFVNVTDVSPDGRLNGVRIYEFDAQYRLQSITRARGAVYQGNRQWQLRDLVQTRFAQARTSVAKHETANWQSVLEPGLLNVLLVKPDRMSAATLYSYTQHLRDNRQKTQRYEIAFWSKIMYPFAVIAMMMLALPFAYSQRRQGGVGAKLFAGIMLGLAFHFLNRLSAHLGLLNDWPPITSAILPTAVFLTIAIVMMWWQERR